MSAEFDQAVRAIRARDPRYAAPAYTLVRDGLSYTARKLGKHHAEGHDRHMSGLQLSLGMRDFARERYGCCAAYLLTRWGIRKSDDFGTIVFQLIDAGIFGKSEDDSPEDFHNRFDFRAEFVAPYEPGIRLRRRAEPCAEQA